MAYGDKYILNWATLNGEACELAIQQLNWIGYDAIPLLADATPCTLQSDAGDEDICYGVRGQSMTVRYVDDGNTPITDFYTENDKEFKAVLRINSVIYWEGFLVPDDCIEDFWANPHVVQLSFNDALGLLDAIPLSDAINLQGANVKKSLAVLLTAITDATGLEFDTNFYNNVFEINQNDRGAAATNYPDEQTFVYPQSWKDGSAYRSCLAMLQDYLLANDSILYQAWGQWNIVRVPEFARFSGNPPGTRIEFGNLTSKAVSDGFSTLGVGDGYDVVPVNFTQTSSIRRGYKSVTRTFPYENFPYIPGGDLQELGTFIGSTVDGSNTLYDYEFPANTIYEQQGQVGYIRVVRETATGRELDRYMVIEYDNVLPVNGMPSAAMVTQKIEVKQGEIIDFKCGFRAAADTSDNIYFGLTFYLRSCDGLSFKILGLTNNVDPSTDRSFWQTYIPFTPFDPGAPPPRLRVWVAPADNATEWNQVSSTSSNHGFGIDPNGFGIAPFPFDGTLEIGFYGFNEWSVIQQGSATAYVKDIGLRLIDPLSDVTLLVGQIHKAELNATIKAILDQEVKIDDAPSPINSGAMSLGDALCDPLTSEWKPESGTPVETYRFGEIQTIDRLLVNQGVRTRIEGDFYWNTLPSFKDLFAFQYGNLGSRVFLLTKGSLDFKTSLLSATFDELYKDGDATINNPTYTFTFKYKDAD